MPRPLKRLLALAVDSAVCAFCVWLALSLRFEQWHVVQGPQWWAVAAAPLLAIPFFIVFGLYRAIFRYAGSASAMAVLRACCLFGLAYGLVFAVIGMPGVPRSIGVVVPLLVCAAVSSVRALARYWLGGTYSYMRRRHALPQVFIYGAGQAGRQLAAALDMAEDMVVRGFVDDDVRLQGGIVQGVRVHSLDWLSAHAARLGITDVLLAMPSVPQSQRARILSALLPLRVHVRTLPGVDQLAQGKVRVNDLNNVRIEDLLGRDAVAPVNDLLHRNLRGQVVLVTGAGGSIGSELCRQIARQRPLMLLLVEWSEFALYAIHGELERAMPGLKVVPLLASVCDEARMQDIMRTFRPATVYHAAAYKHVPLVEHNPAEGLRNNVLGTLITARAAQAWGVSRFVLVSTDKAVRPTNIMGASKRLAEMSLQALAQKASGTCFSMVRFGNVLGSSGSVVPLFQRQIAAGGPITLTDREITRYFMTIPEAAQLVIQAGAMADGGEVFVLDMGEPVRIVDLARRLVELSGHRLRDEDNPDGDIELKITGLRPGEKLYEELLIEDNALATPHARIRMAQEPCLPALQLWPCLQRLEALLDLGDVQAVKDLLSQLVPGYRPHAEVVDWLHMAAAGALVPRPGVQPASAAPEGAAGARRGAPQGRGGEPLPFAV